MKDCIKMMLPNDKIVDILSEVMCELRKWLQDTSTKAEAGAGDCGLNGIVFWPVRDFKFHDFVFLKQRKRDTVLVCQMVPDGNSLAL